MSSARPRLSPQQVYALALAPRRRSKFGPPQQSRLAVSLTGTYNKTQDNDDRGPLPELVIRPPTLPKPSAEKVQARRWKRRYLELADRYAREVADEKNAARHGYWMRLAARRYLTDRLRARQPHAPFYFDEWYACDPCEFIEGLPHVEGTWETDTIVLHASDIFFLVNLFGFRAQNGTRRFTTALKAVARKNAKSTLAAGIGLYCEVCEGEHGPQVISAATTGGQARIIFNIAKRMVEKTSVLRKKFGLSSYANAIACFDCGGTFKPINAKASTQDGLNPSCTLVDEVHAHKTHDLVNVLRSAAGARSNSLFLFTTTEGYENPGPWPELRHYAKQVLEGVVPGDHFFAVYYALDDASGHPGDPDYKAADDDFDESCWQKANPLIDVNPILLKKLREEAGEARQMPGRLAEFRIKRLNRPASTSGGWINLVKWKECGRAVDLAMLKQYPCWGGLDLASVSDFVSLRLVWRVERKWYTHGWRFVPRAMVRRRHGVGLVPYQAWVTGGYLIETGDEVTDYDTVEQQILQVKREFNLQTLSYDSWNATQLAQKLSNQNVKCEEFIQGPKSYHPAMKELERAYTEGNLNHGNDPVLNWCASNLIARTDVNMNMAPDKKSAPDKIDDMVALLMAMGTALKVPTVAKPVQLFFV